MKKKRNKARTKGGASGVDGHPTSLKKSKSTLTDIKNSLEIQSSVWKKIEEGGTWGKCYDFWEGLENLLRF